jgi:hypothetical protein
MRRPRNRADLLFMAVLIFAAVVMFAVFFGHLVWRTFGG